MNRERREHAFEEEIAFSSFPPVAEVWVTADGHLFGIEGDENGQIRLVWDGIRGEPFDELVVMRDGREISWSDDNKHVAYTGLRGGRSFVGRDGTEDPAFEAPTRSVPPTFSADGTHLAYGAQVDGVYRLIVDGQPTGDEALAPIAAVWSADGNRLAYVQLSGPAGEKPKERIVLDGEAGDWFLGMRNAPGVLQFSPDSRRFAFYRTNEKLEGQWTVDGVAQRWVNDVAPLTIARLRGVAVLDPPIVARFSADSQRFAYWADVKEKGVAVIEDDLPGPLLHAAGWPIFSPDSRHVAYGGESFGKRVVVVLDGAVGKEWAPGGSGDPVFSPDGQHVATMLHHDEGSLFRKHHVCTVVFDDQLLAEQPGDDASTVAFSPDGTHVAWGLRRGSDFFVFVDDRPGARLDGTGDPMFSASGRLVHLAGIGASSTIMVDGQPGPLAEAIPPSTSYPPEVHFQLSSDGNHVAWIGQFADGARPILDAKTGPAFESVYGCAFLDDGSVQWWGRRGDTISRVIARP